MQQKPSSGEEGRCEHKRRSGVQHGNRGLNAGGRSGAAKERSSGASLETPRFCVWSLVSLSGGEVASLAASAPGDRLCSGGTSPSRMQSGLFLAKAYPLER